MSKTVWLVLIGVGVWYFFLRDKAKPSGGGPVPADYA